MKCLCFLIILSAPAFMMADAQKARHLKNDPVYLHQSIKAVTDVIVHDIFSPPVASRIYAYTTVAGYETLRFGYPGYRSFAGQLHNLTPVPKPEAGKNYNYDLASVHAVLLVGKAMVISEERIEMVHERILVQFKQSRMPADVYDNSLAFGKQVADHVLAWASKDNYKQTRSFPRYAVGDDAASWKPTPPAYIKAIEPHWSKIRPFIIDSAQQFKPAPAIPFSADTGSRFFAEAGFARKTGLALTAEQIEIANFWDCNPYKMNISGHVMFATKKISPGGHWINITRLACLKTRSSSMKSAEAYACVAIALADGFISCWDEKYRSNTIRPETYINQYIDKNWVPLLQTPPFPEYTSGHSVISKAASVVLTKLFGERFSFTDSTQLEFKIPARSFRSFQRAADEAAISRLYGGIHYRTAITEGVIEGNQVGQFVIQKLRTRE